MKKFLAFLLAVAGLATAGGTAVQAASPETRMVELVRDLRSYSRAKAPRFQLVGNGAIGLLEVTPTNPAENGKQLLASLDGFLTESVYVLPDENGADTDQPQDYVDYLEARFAQARNAGKAVWTLDYVREPRLQAKDEARGRQAGYVSMAVADKGLASLPEGKVPAVSSRDIRQVTDARNFLFLLNPGHFAGKADYLAALRKAPYDVLVIDLYAGGTPLTPEEVETLRQKPQGGRRLVLAYLSVGEAADYRPYWQKAWQKEPPDWLCAPNPDWPGSYKVRYWTEPWRRLLYGSPEAYLDRILAAGFDGAFLDVLDAWQYFAAGKK